MRKSVACNVSGVYYAFCYMQREIMMSISTSARVQKHRQSLREAGLRPLQIWVPDTRRNGFADECRRQSLLIRDDAADQETCMWLEAVADHDGWQ
ncbi:antitoxin MazE family protein [Methylomonas koyamae]|uniref:antitoxin MazE family protein n=1 Tax=Methylomonas koyamae TaxID=702114 RepID=UPI0028738A77|nr:antitoxin MazE family protein [Methylomonas koyamae]WNB77091.1 antitoxin MazE family protein [Methylomonas koyamae]